MLTGVTHIKPSKGFFRANRSRLVEFLKSRVSTPANSFIILRGAEEEYIYDDDQTYEFAQDNNFWWATGIDQPGAYSLIDLKSGNCTVYVPKVPEVTKYWMRVLELDEYLSYEVDAAKYLSELESDVANAESIYILGGGINKYSGVGPLTPEFEWLGKYNVNTTALYPTFNEVKLHKSEEELILLREAARIGSEAHVFVLQNVKPGINESHIQTLFRFYCGMHGPTVSVPYGEICAAGKNAAILHYTLNSERITDGKMVLVDAGTKINGYCSDITVTFPINGKFTEKQKGIYDIVLSAHQHVRSIVKAGVHWQDVQNEAEKKVLEGLLALGLIKGGSVEELWKKRISYYFFPHGVGHYIGTYVHDLLGDPAKENEKRNIPKQNLRVHRRLEASMVLTNEPGIYFIDRLIQSAKDDSTIAEHFNFDLIAQYAAEVPGVRIEDMLIINANGCEALTKVPRTTEEIEKCMSHQAWN